MTRPFSRAKKWVLERISFFRESDPSVDNLANKLDISKPDHVLAIFIDASASSNNSQVSFGAYAGLKSPLTRAVRLLDICSSFAGEHQACIQTLKKVKQLGLDTQPVAIFTDLIEIINALREYTMERTPRRNVSSEKYLKVIWDLAQSCRKGVYFVYIPAHANIAQNEISDCLAGMGRITAGSLLEKATLARINNRSNLRERKKQFAIVFCKYDSQVNWETSDRDILNTPLETIWDASNTQLHDLINGWLNYTGMEIIDPEKLLRDSIPE